MKNITSWEFVKGLKNGWNLGNTLDSISKVEDAGLAHEIGWGNPYTTKEMVQLVKDSGFSIFRIPITWWPHFVKGTKCTIDPAWMARVKEVVDMAYDMGLYVIINLHHENWHYLSKENLASAKEILCGVWTQIAEVFQDYDEHLIFEGLNEPRITGSPYEWIGGTKEARDVLNELNLAFVHLIRMSGGNNRDRQLMIPTHSASVKLSSVSELIVPDDKIIVSAHAYVPTDFAIIDDGIDTFDANRPSSTEPIHEAFDLLQQYFLDKKIPVIMGECGARDRGGNLKDRVECTRYYLKVAKEHGVPCIWWDNGYLNRSDAFAIMNRQKVTWEYPEIMSLLVE